MNYGHFDQCTAKVGRVIAFVSSRNGTHAFTLDAESDLVEVIEKYNTEQTRVISVTFARITQVIDNSGR